MVLILVGTFSDGPTKTKVIVWFCCEENWGGVMANGGNWYGEHKEIPSSAVPAKVSMVEEVLKPSTTTEKTPPFGALTTYTSMLGPLSRCQAE